MLLCMWPEQMLLNLLFKCGSKEIVGIGDTRELRIRGNERYDQLRPLMMDLKRPSLYS